MPPSIVSNKLSHRFVFTTFLSLLYLIVLNTPLETAVPVGPELQISSGSSPWAFHPDVGMAASGDFFVVWMGETSNIFGRRFDYGGVPYGPEFQINTSAIYEGPVPRIATNGAGRSVVVWTSRNKVMGKRFDHMGNAVGSEFEVYADSVFYQYLPSVGMDADGNFAVAWVCQYMGWPFDYTTVLCKRFNNDAVPVGSHFEVNEVGYSYPDDLCELSMNESGEFIVVWDAISPGRMFQRYDSYGNPVGGNVEMDTDLGGFFPTVAMNNSGNFVIAWTTWRQDGSEVGVAAQRYDSSGAEIGSDFQVNTYTYLRQDYPAVAMDNEGRFTVVWQSQQEDTISSKDSWGIYGQQYDATGGMSGSEMHVNTHEDGFQNSARIAMIDGDKFVVVWDIGPDIGPICAQVYGPDTTAVDDRSPPVILFQNYPNPFYPLTTIRFHLNRTEAVRLTIYNSAGHHIRTLIDRQMSPGPCFQEWDGKNDSGQTVASGIYLYRIRAGDYVNVKKMVFVK